MSSEPHTKGKTLIDYAAEQGKIDIVKLLIEKGCYFNVLEGVSVNILSKIAGYLENDKTANSIANLIILKKEFYKRNLKLTPSAIRHEEVGAHDVSFAKVSLNEVKKLFSLKNIAAVPSFEESVVSIQQIIIERINSSNASDNLKNSLKPYNSDKFLANYDKNDTNHLAFLWIMTFQNSMILRTDPAMGLVKEMLRYIIACRNELTAEKSLGAAKEIEDVLIFQLSNLMQANEEMMSCAPGTPRGLKVVLNAYLALANPSAAVFLLQDSLDQSVYNVLNKILLDMFSKIDSNASNLFNEDEEVANKEHLMFWLSATEGKEINQYKDFLRRACDIMALIGSDNIAKLLQSNQLDGIAVGKPIEVSHWLLRNKKIKKYYPTYADFRSAVLANMRSTSEQTINLSIEHEYYLQLQYVAVSNEKIRDKFYETLGAKISDIDKQLDKINAPNNILRAINTYQTDLSNINRSKLKNVLQQSISLLVDNIDLDRAQDVVSDVMKNIVNNKNMTLIDTKNLFNKLKKDYDAAVEHSIKSNKI